MWGNAAVGSAVCISAGANIRKDGVRVKDRALREGCFIPETLSHLRIFG